MDVFATMADPTRRLLLHLLRPGERSVGDLVVRSKVQQPEVSRHLRILKEAGFVNVRPDAQKRLYSLNAAGFREVDAWIAEYRHLLGERLDRFGDVVEGLHRESKGKQREK